MPKGRVAFVSRLAQNYCLPPGSALQQHQLMFGSKAVSCTRCKDSIRYTATEHFLVHLFRAACALRFVILRSRGFTRHTDYSNMLCVLQSLRSRRVSGTNHHAQQGMLETDSGAAWRPTGGQGEPSAECIGSERKKERESSVHTLVKTI